MRVEIRDLRKNFGPLRALDGISFDFESGNIWGFIGPNGAGKTTTMRIMVGIDVPDGGEVLYDGISVIEYPERVSKIVGFMPDSLPARNNATVAEYLELFARAQGLKGSFRQKMLKSVIEFTGLGDLRNRGLDGLSKGMKQRLSLARALVHNPQILILDEPAAGLDPRARVELRQLLRALAEQGKGILISSHILSELSEICDGTCIIEQGRLIRSGRLEQVIEDSSVRREVLLRVLDGTEILHQQLLEHPRVMDIRMRDHGARIKWLGSDEDFAEFLAATIGRGIPLVEAGFEEASLESLFLHATQGEIQ